MLWLTYGLTFGALLLVFVLTGGPVAAHMNGSSLNYYNEKNTAYYCWLVWHYWLGALTIGFLAVGSVRHACWTDDGKQAAFVWAFSFLIASVFTVWGCYAMMPDPPGEGGSGGTAVLNMASAANQTPPQPTTAGVSSSV